MRISPKYADITEVCKEESMSARGKLIVRRLLSRLIQDNRPQTADVSQRTLYRRSLKGGVKSRSVACKKASEYLAATQLENPANVPLPSALIPVIAQLRATAGDVRMRALERLAAIERLLRIEGYSFAPQGYEPLDRLLDKYYGETPEKQPSKTATEIRTGTRAQAFKDVLECFRTDRANGCFKSLADVVLRLPEHPAPEKSGVSLKEQHKDELAKVLDMFRNSRRNDDVL
jgi:hypothetical protein